MNNPRDKNEKLLAELFHADWSDGPAADFARRAAAHARRRHQLRSVVAAGATAALAVLIALTFTRPRSAPPVVVPLPAPAPAYEIISDAELLAQLHDRPLLVVQKQNGTKDFILLER